MKEFSIVQNWWQFLIVAIVCYLIGCFNFARVISRKKQRDITTIGSGNPGTMNMTREFGIKTGFLTFLCDALKGGVPALICYFIYRSYIFEGTEIPVSDLMRYFAGLFVVVGHIFPVTMKFKGGKGIASTLGLFWFGLMCESPWWILIGFGVLLTIVLVIYVTEYGSVGSLYGVTTFSIIQAVIFLLRYNDFAVNAYLVCLYVPILLIVILTWAAHHQNLRRLFAGEEHKTSLKQMIKKKNAQNDKK